MSNNFGNLGKLTAVSQLIRNAYVDKLAPLAGFTTDASADIASKGQAVTVHLYNNSTAASIQDVSGTNAIDYTLANVTSDVSLTAVTVTLNRYAPDGFSIPELDWNKFVVKDLYSKFAPKVVQKLAKSVLVDVFSAVTAANFSNTVAVSAGTFDYAKYLDVCKVGWDLDYPDDAAFVLDNARYTSLVKSLPSLAGVDVSEILKTGTIPGGILNGYAVSRSNVVPVNTVGFLATKDAMAVAIRPLAPMQAGLSYGTSMIISDSEAQDGRGTGISLRVRQFQDPATGKFVVEFDNLYGYTAFNSAALIRLN